LADVDSFNATLGRLRPAVNGPGWTSYTTCALEIEQAEFARVHLRDLPQARHRYNHVFRLSRDEPIHRGQALLGLAEVARQAGEDPSPFLAELTATTDAHPIGYLQAHLSITQFLIGELSASAALARIEEVAPQLTSRAATQAASPLDFCLGGRPEDHETFLP